MLSKSLICAAASLAALAVAAGANAATITINHVYDPSNVQLVSISGEALAAPVTLSVGDTLDLTLTFTGGQIATAVGEDMLWLGLTTNTGSSTLNTSGTFELLGVSGNGVAGPIAFSQDASFVHVGPSISSGLYRTNAAPLSFSGLRLILTIDGTDGLVTRDYDRIFLTSFSGQYTFSGAVPEPATWAMMIGGFGLVGGALRTRRRALAA